MSMPGLRIPQRIAFALALTTSACAGTLSGERPKHMPAVIDTTADTMKPMPMPAPMDTTVQQRLLPQVDRLLQQLIRQQRAMSIDGQHVFNGRDKFLPGKIAVGMANIIVKLPSDDPRLETYLSGFRRISAVTIDDENVEWGIFYYLSALEMIDRAGLLDRAVAPEILQKLKQKLDWRTFVREKELTLIGLPNNYFGVAFGVAQFRADLGWEDDTAAKALLAKTLAHYRTYSATGFADETEGDGRYDRYSVLLIGEIAHRFIEAGREPPAEIKAWLRGSAELMLLRVGPDGDGFEYGRSIGAYGETAVIEVLTAAAVLKVLTPEETDVAYAISSRITQRYMDFWIDAQTGSVNLWDKGRRTDAYRGKHRILGENLSLARQFFYTNDLWNRLGYRGVAPKADLSAWKHRLPRATLTRFSVDEPQRALVTVVDGERLFGLPFINGGAGQHMHSPYFPIPFSANLVSGIADSSAPQLTPRFVLEDGSVLQPLAYYTDIHAAMEGDAYVVTAALPTMDRMGGDKPVPDSRMRGNVRYAFSPGRIERIDEFLPSPELGVARYEMEFANYGVVRQLRRDGANWVAEFEDPILRKFMVSGFEECEMRPVPSADYQTPTGAFRSVLRCVTAERALKAPFKLGLRIDYARNP
jgi:hypothetical protein